MTHVTLIVKAPSNAKNPATPTIPTTPAPKAKKTVWCVPKAGVSDAQLQANLDYACSHGTDCSSIQPGGACFEPNTVASHATYAMNQLYQTAGRNPWDCDFSQTATLSTTNPSKLLDLNNFKHLFGRAYILGQGPYYSSTFSCEKIFCLTFLNQSCS